MKNYLNKNWPLLFFPFMVIPFIILIFYILGGGSAPASERREVKPAKGKVAINYRLPEADRTIGIVDKMEAVQAQTQSYGTQDYHIGAENTSGLITSENDGSKPVEAQNQEGENQSNQSVQPESGVPDQLMVHIRKQEAQVKLELRQAAGDTAVCAKGEGLKSADPAGSADNYNPGQQNEAASATAKVNHGTTGIEEIDALFDRSLALARQNDSLNYKLQEASAIQEQQTAAEAPHHFTLDREKNNSLVSKKTSDSAQPTTGAIPAEIYETATVLSGNRVKIRLLEETRLNGQVIPRNTFVYGICRTDNERLQIEVQQILVSGQFIPVKMTVCDLDGLQGLYVPDNASRKITKEVGSGVNTSSMAGFTGNPLAYAGVQAADRAARSVLQVIKQKKVTIKKNTLVYLINKNK
ncbi:MAG: conjugative transposon protein TraM [Mariniphaga sp.]|nr:conjugative transposon protein TraM [Mariniphaga sp.]